MLVIELNEFNPNYVKAEALKLNLNNILFFLNLKHAKTFTNDKIEHHGLDPWVQWVSIHSGVPFKEHKIARLGQTKIQAKQQIWNKISKNSSKTCGVWGVMNAPRGSEKGLDFFLPDPWSYEEKAYPKLLDDFLSLPRYMAKNYLSPKFFKLLSKTKKTLSFIIKNMGNGDSRKIIKHLIKACIYAGLNIHSLTTLLDYINCLYFIKYRKKYNSDFSIIFLNHLAHLQHHFWNKNGKISNQMNHRKE